MTLVVPKQALACGKSAGVKQFRSAEGVRAAPDFGAERIKEN
jgi:hypothetical protein